MGGGEFVRAAAKMAGVGVINVGHRSSSNVPKFEQLLRGKSMPTSVAAASSKVTVGGIEAETVQKPTWEIDDWEFAGFEDDIVSGGPKPRLVFGSVPSFDEAREATTELKEALDKVYISSPESCGSNLSVSSSNCELQTKSCLVIESIPCASVVPKHALQAFKLLNENTAVQTAVASIASDPNVWNAILDNDEVKSLLKSYQTNEGLKPEKIFDELEDAPDASNDKESGNLFSDAVDYIKTKIAGMVVHASNFLQNIFGSPEVEDVSGDDKAATSGLGFAQKTAMGASIMGLVIMVVMVLVAKRN